MFTTGLLYNHLDYDDIGDLQVMFSEFSPFGENTISNQIAQSKADFDKTQALVNVEVIV